MEKTRRSERMVVMTKVLTGQPERLFSLNYFADMFQSAKSTVSEDLALMRETITEFGLGHLATVPGAAGGVKYNPWLNEGQVASFLGGLAGQLAAPERIIPGGYLYMTDLIFNPAVAGRIGEVFATLFKLMEPEFVVTIETKGIPLAMMTARAFSAPLVIIRDEGKVTEGSAVSINYVSGSTRRIRTMSLARRALPTGAKVLLIDDFMRAGGTARGMHDLMREFQAEVLGTGVLVSMAEPREKLVGDYVALLELERIDERERAISIRPGRWAR